MDWKQRHPITYFWALLTQRSVGVVKLFDIKLHNHDWLNGFTVCPTYNIFHPLTYCGCKVLCSSSYPLFEKLILSVTQEALSRTCHMEIFSNMSSPVCLYHSPLSPGDLSHPVMHQRRSCCYLRNWITLHDWFAHPHSPLRFPVAKWELAVLTRWGNCSIKLTEEPLGMLSQSCLGWTVQTNIASRVSLTNNWLYKSGDGNKRCTII